MRVKSFKILWCTLQILLGRSERAERTLIKQFSQADECYFTARCGVAPAISVRTRISKPLMLTRDGGEDTVAAAACPSPGPTRSGVCSRLCLSAEGCVSELPTGYQLFRPGLNNSSHLEALLQIMLILIKISKEVWYVGLHDYRGLC